MSLLKSSTILVYDTKCPSLTGLGLPALNLSRDSEGLRDRRRIMKAMD